MATLPPLGNPNPQLADALKQLSAAKFGRPKPQVEAAIFKRLETQAPLRPGSSPFGSLPPSRPGFGSAPSPFAPPASRPGLGAPAPSPAPKPAASGSSFLDEWLSKRKENIVKPTAIPPTQQRPQPKPQPPKQPAAAKPASPKEEPKLEAAVDRSQPKAGEGEFKIDRDIDPAKHQSQVVHIDKEGNLSFGE